MQVPQPAWSEELQTADALKLHLGNKITPFPDMLWRIFSSFLRVSASLHEAEQL
jgi:hypothetical protein